METCIKAIRVRYAVFIISLGILKAIVNMK